MTGYAFVLASGRLERVQAVSNVASVAAASDVPVDVFATMDGLEAFDADRVATGDFDVGPVGEAMLAGADEMALFTENFAQAKSIGPLSVYACELSMDLLDKDLDDYDDVVDEVLGVSGFLGRAEDKQVVFV
jgi:peroxiredoxin family protein